MRNNELNQRNDEETGIAASDRPLETKTTQKQRSVCTRCGMFCFRFPCE